MRRALLRLAAVALATALVVVVAAAADSGNAGARAERMALGDSLELDSVSVDKTGMLIPAAWSVPENGDMATWAPYFGQTTYEFKMPQSIPAAGAPVTLKMTVKAAEGQRFAPGMAILGDADFKGKTEIHALAESGQSAQASSTVTIVPRAYPSGTDFANIVVGLQDGPQVTYKYRVSSGSESVCAKYRRTQGRQAINEVRVVAVKPDVRVHCEGAPDEEWLPVHVGDVIKQGDEISCDPDGEATLAFADNSTVTVRNTTQLKIASFFTEGGVVRTEILLKMGQVAAKVNKSEATKSDFRIKQPTATASTRGTTFSVFYDPGSKASVTSVTEGVVAVDPTKAGLPNVDVPAGKEVEVTAAKASPIAPIGQADARGGVNRVTARDLALKVVARFNGPCKITTPRAGAYGVKPAGAGWLVSIRIQGKLKGWSTWQVTGRKVTPANPLAKKIAAGCR